MTSSGANTWNLPLEVNNLESQIANHSATAVQSVTSGNANVTIGGTLQNPTVAATLTAFTSNVAAGGFNLTSVGTLSATNIIGGSITTLSSISTSPTAVEVGIGGGTIGILLSTSDASRYTLGQSITISGNSEAQFNNTFVITYIGLPNILNTNNPYSIPQFTTGSGGTISIGSITTSTLTTTNLNGVGATNVLTVGGATNGSIVVQSTAGFITVPTISNGANDFTIGSASSGYTTVFSQNINNTLYPVAPFGSQSGSFGWNGNALGGEFSFLNNFGSSSLGGFTFIDRTGASSKRLLAKITETNFDIGVNANLNVGNGTISASPSGATVSIYATNTGSVNLISRSGGNVGFFTNNGGSSGGNFQAMTVNSFASGGVQAGYIDIFHANGVASGSSFEQYVYNGVIIGSVTQNGTANVLYNTSSDYRLKSNVKPIDAPHLTLQRLKPCSFTWTQDNRDDIGFIAHEFAEIFPDSVVNQKDEIDEKGNPKYQQMSNNACIPLLVACVKEQQTEITDLKAQLVSLKAIVESLVAGRV